MNIPESGRSADEILSTLAHYRAHDLSWQSGRVLAFIYDPGRESDDLMKRAYMDFLTINGLDPTSFPSVARLETEVVRMVINLLRGGPEVVGNFTSGGTESILLAVKTARDYMRAHRPGTTHPEMVLPATAHSAFHKAAAYFDLKAVSVDVKPDTFEADVDAMRRAITPNTILLACSAPGYAHGVVDPVADIAALALEHGILCHVDGCVGGIHLSFLREMGRDIPAFDWTTPGVTSISTDLHKYGYAAKNASVVMFRDRALRRHEIFSCTRTATYALINLAFLPRPP